MKLPHARTALVYAALFFATAVRAAEGHDHGDAGPAGVGQALPRFSAVSQTFELVGVLSGRQITLYLDRFGDNSPVRNARIELEIGGAKFKAQPAQGRLGDDEYEVVLPEAPKPGVVPVTATVSADGEADVLAGELDIHEAAHVDDTAHRRSWKEIAGWAAAGIAALSLLAWSGRRAMVGRGLRARGVA